MAKFFDYFVLDSNFFIALLESGIEDVLAEIKGILKVVKAKAACPASLPVSDIPRKFRSLRRLVPDHIHLIPVNRKGESWNHYADSVKRHHFIRVQDDPADVDCLVLAFLISKKGKKVALVSDDQGVVRGARLAGMEQVSPMSNGSFLSMLATLVKDKKTRQKIEGGAERVFKNSWQYKRKTRSYIDISMLVDDLTDTAHFVRIASESIQEKEREKTVEKIKVTSKEKPLDITPFQAVMELFKECRNLRENNNLFQAEQQIINASRKSSAILNSVTDVTENLILFKYITAETFEHYSWCLQYRIERNELLEASFHAQSCLTLFGYLNVGEEMIENILALQGLILLLLGNTETGLRIFKLVPPTGDISGTQQFGLTVAYLASKDKKALSQLEKNYKGINEEAINGIFSALMKYADDCTTRNRHELAITIMTYLITTSVFENTPEELKEQACARLFFISRINPNILSNKVQKILKTTLGITGAKDNTLKPLQKKWTTKVPFDIQVSEFNENFHILNRRIPLGKAIVEVTAFGDRTKSVWRINFSLDHLPALQVAISFKLAMGIIEKFIRKPKESTEYYRGTIVVQDPILQIEIRRPWD